MPDTAVRADSKICHTGGNRNGKGTARAPSSGRDGDGAAPLQVTAPSGNKPARRIAGDVIVTYASALASLSGSGCDPAVSGRRLRPGLRGLGLRV